MPGILLLVISAALACTALWPKPAHPANVYAASGRPLVKAKATLPNGLIDINTADLFELTELPGIGETLAQAVIDEREAHGLFRYPEDLLYVRGIGAARLEAIRDLICLSGGNDE